MAVGWRETDDVQSCENEIAENQNYLENASVGALPVTDEAKGEDHTFRMMLSLPSFLRAA